VSKILTFIDTGVLITATRGQGENCDHALAILQDPDREFASSPFLKLEVLPKAIYNRQSEEIEFYEAYFDAVTYWARDLESIVTAAYQEMAASGLGAMDALHVAAAVMLGATEFITSEKSTKSIFRTSSIRILSISA
jgi:predicted nucleic acid-binding protein